MPKSKLPPCDSYLTHLRNYAEIVIRSNPDPKTLHEFIEFRDKINKILEGQE